MPDSPLSAESEVAVESSPVMPGVPVLDADDEELAPVGAVDPLPPGGDPLVDGPPVSPSSVPSPTSDDPHAITDAIHRPSRNPRTTPSVYQRTARAGNGTRSSSPRRLSPGRSEMPCASQCIACARCPFSRVVFDDHGRPLAWGSTFHTYGTVWEIHPLIVDVKHHRKGHGARLLADIEAVAASRGAGVLIVGTSDETGFTSLSGKDLYLDPLAAMANMTFHPSHAVGFWLRMGYSLVGITPDAEGPGMPTINLAKRPPARP